MFRQVVRRCTCIFGVRGNGEGSSQMSVCCDLGVNVCVDNREKSLIPEMEEFKCQMCGKQFGRRSAIRRHRRRVHPRNAEKNEPRRDKGQGLEWLQGGWETLLDELNQGPTGNQQIIVTIPMDEWDNGEEETGVTAAPGLGEETDTATETTDLPCTTQDFYMPSVPEQTVTTCKDQYTQTNTRPVLAIPHRKPDTYLENQEWAKRIQVLKERLAGLEGEIKQNMEVMKATGKRSVREAKRVIESEL